MSAERKLGPVEQELVELNLERVLERLAWLADDELVDLEAVANELATDKGFSPVVFHRNKLIRVDDLRGRVRRARATLATKGRLR